MGRKLSRPIRAYAGLLDQIKTRIRQAQSRAVLSANAEMIALYWDIGRLIHDRQEEQGWGASVIPRLARDLRNDLSEVKGFSERNLKRMAQFYHEHPALLSIGPQAVAQLTDVSTKSLPAAQLPGPGNSSISPQAVAKSPTWREPAIGPQPVAQFAETTSSTSHPALSLPWGHIILLMEKFKDPATRLWYMRQTIKEGWSRNVLAMMIKGRAHERQGKVISNFAELLPPEQSDLLTQALKDPYIFDFLTLDEPFHERELEAKLLEQLEKFLIELGQGFAFVGRQYHVEVNGEDFSIDLLFYHLHLRCFLVIDLKTGEFKPEYTGKMNFYLNTIDDQLRHRSDAPSVGLILCRDRNRVVAEYALRGIKKPIGVAEYQLTRSLPKELRSSLPSIEQIEAELSRVKKQPKAIRRKIKPTRSPRQRRKRQR